MSVALHAYRAECFSSFSVGSSSVYSCGPSNICLEITNSTITLMCVYKRIKVSVRNNVVLFKSNVQLFRKVFSASFMFDIFFINL